MFKLIIVGLLAKGLIFLVEVGPKVIMNGEGYGQYAYFLTQVLLFSSIISFGGQNLIVKEISSSNISNKVPFIESTVLSLLIYILICFVFFMFSFDVLSVTVGFLFALILNNTTFFRCSGRTKYWYLCKDIFRAVFFLSIFGICYFYFDGIVTFKNSVFSYASSILIVAIISSLHILQKGTKYKAILRGAITNVVPRFKMSAPVIFTGFTYLLLSRLDSFFIKEWIGFEALGDYSSLSRILYQSLFIQQLLLAKELHKVAGDFGELKFSQAIENSKKLRLKIIASTSLLSIIIVCIVNLEIIKEVMIFGDILWLSIIFALSHIFVSVFSLYGYMLLYTNKHYYEYFNCIIIVLTAVILHFLLIPKYGLIGAAISTSFSIVLGNILEWIQFRYMVKPSLKDGLPLANKTYGKTQLIQ